MLPLSDLRDSCANRRFPCAVLLGGCDDVTSGKVHRLRCRKIHPRGWARHRLTDHSPFTPRSFGSSGPHFSDLGMPGKSDLGSTKFLCPLRLAVTFVDSSTPMSSSQESATELGNAYGLLSLLEFAFRSCCDSLAVNFNVPRR